MREVLYDVHKIKVLDDESPNTLNGVGTPNSELEGVSACKGNKRCRKTMEKYKELFDSTLDSTKYTFTLFLSYIITN